MKFSDFLKRSFNLKIFSLNRIKYEELWQDALANIKKVYNDSDESFNASSPFAQLLSVILHLGRMIIYYIEDSITGLNIKTAWRPDQIRGLARLTGHDPTRSISSRAAIKIIYSADNSNEYSGKTAYIPNKTRIYNTYNGLTYTILFGADSAKYTMTADPNDEGLNANIVQGTIKYQQVTGSGEKLQSFNFAERNYSTIDQYYINVYVNGIRWNIVSSLLDMGFNQQSVVVKTGQTGGLDLFFGNGDMGSIPPLGSTIMCEYLVTSGENGNVSKDLIDNDNWSFMDNGYLSDGTELQLNNFFKIFLTSDIMFGAPSENILLTQEIAPFTSRSMVLGNSLNYKYFLEKMNLFSIVDVIQGFNTFEDIEYENEMKVANSAYIDRLNTYKILLKQYGSSTPVVNSALVALNSARQVFQDATKKVNLAKMDDNTVYLFLVPNIPNRIGNSNYFTCDEGVFNFSDDEKYNILNLIDISGQSVITVENKIIEPKNPRFAINIQIRIWDTYKFGDIREQILTKLSDYFISLKRRDRIPISDIISIVDGIEGVDSAYAFFVADSKNYLIYDYKKADITNNGIDNLGDIVLSRSVITSLKNLNIRDIYPLIRGGFTSSDGLYYDEEQNWNVLSAINISLIGTSNKYISSTMNLENTVSE